MATSLPARSAAHRPRRLIREARLDDDVKALVLRVDSPGGSVLASEEIYRELLALKAAGKPLVVSMGDLAASGGYYIAAPADEILASPATITGSIGIFAIIPTIDRSLDKLGVHVDGVGTTPLSGQLRLDRPLGEGAKQLLQSTISHGYDEFLARVSSGRKKTARAGRCHRAGPRMGGRRCEAARSGGSSRLVRRCRRGRRAAREPQEVRNQFIQPELSVAQQLALELQTEAIGLALRLDGNSHPLLRAAAAARSARSAKWSGSAGSPRRIGSTPTAFAGPRKKESALRGRARYPGVRSRVKGDSNQIVLLASPDRSLSVPLLGDRGDRKEVGARGEIVDHVAGHAGVVDGDRLVVVARRACRNGSCSP